MSTQSTVTFKVAGNDVVSFMDKMKQKADQLTTDMIANARKQADSSKDQLKSLDDQIKALERKNRIEAEGARQTAAKQRDALQGQAKNEYAERVGIVNAAFDEGKIGLREKKVQTTKAQDALETSTSGIDKDFRDQLTTIREQERQSVLQTKLLRDNIETVKTTAGQQIMQMRKGDDELVETLDKNATPMQQLARDVAAEKYLDEQDKNKKGKGTGAGDIVSGMLNVENIKALMGSMSTFTSTQNGFDLIKPASKGIGNILGTVLGGILGTLVEPGAGTMMGAGLGGQIGGMFGDTVGEFEQRRAMSSQDFLQAKNAVEARTGKQVIGLPDESRMGVAASDYLQVLKQIAETSASTARATENTSAVLHLEKGVGVSRQVSSEFLTFFRGTSKDINNLVAGVMEKGKNTLFKGGDFTFMNEFLGNMTKLMTQMRHQTENVSTGNVYQILSTFDKLGGIFSARDTRSEELIGKIESSLTNPTSDSTKAYSFLALRKANPGAGIADLMMQQQMGFQGGGGTYFANMLKSINQMGGDEQMKRMNISGMFGISQVAAKRIYDNMDSLMNSKMTGKDLEELGVTKDFKKIAEEKTTPIEQNMADIKNGLLGTWYDSVDAMADSFKVAMENAFKGSTITLSNGEIKLGGASGTSTPVKSNKVVSKKTQDYQAAMGGAIGTSDPYR